MTPVEADIAVDPIPAGFERWEALLALIRTAFAPMDGVIDPPSSVHRLTPETLRAKAQSWLCCQRTRAVASASACWKPRSGMPFTRASR